MCSISPIRLHASLPLAEADPFGDCFPLIGPMRSRPHSCAALSAVMRSSLHGLLAAMRPAPAAGTSNHVEAKRRHVLLECLAVQMLGTQICLVRRPAPRCADGCVPQKNFPTRCPSSAALVHRSVIALRDSPWDKVSHDLWHWESDDLHFCSTAHDKKNRRHCTERRNAMTTATRTDSYSWRQ